MAAYIVPPAIIFINNDISAKTKSYIQKQLFITESYDGYQFDTVVAENPNYVIDVHNSNRRVLVTRSFLEHTNRDLADVVVFVSHGLAAVEKNKFGPPAITVKILDLYWQQLCIFYAPKPYYKGTPCYVKKSCNSCKTNCRNSCKTNCGNSGACKSCRCK